MSPRKLTPNEINQLEYLLKEYPMLDMGILETVLRITTEQRDQIMSEKIELELPQPPEFYIRQTVNLE